MQIALAFAALCMPGLAWWLWLGDHKQDGGEALARIFAISASFITLVALAFYTVRLSFTPLAIGLLLSLCIGLVIAGLIHSWKTAFNKTWLAALAVLAIFVVWRMWQARDLVFPNWVDSQHHVLIIRKIIENGGLPSTLEPYLPGPFYYHFSFHAVTALFSVLSGLAPEQAALVLGQVINACVGISVYALTKALSDDWRVGLLAAFFVTFVTKMPGYYLTWGRYTLLIGVMILPVAMAEAERLRRGARDWLQGIGLFLLTVGALLSHYLAAFLLGLYLVIIGIGWVIKSIKVKKADWNNLLILLLPSVLGLLASMRWYIRVLRYSAGFVNTPVQVPDGALTLNASQLEYLRFILGPNVAYGLMGLAAVGIMWALLKEKWRNFGLWSLLVALFTLPLGIKIFSFRSDYYGLILFVSIAVLSAGLLIWLFDFLFERVSTKKLLMVIGIVLILGFIGWGGWRTADAINDETVLVTEADVAALDWVKSHTPEDARFFVNTTGWGFGMYRGTDGGGWLLPTTGRWSLAPTIFYPYGADSKTSATWNDWSARASIVTTCETDFWELVDEANLGYVYVRRGTSGLQAEALAGCQDLSRLYFNDEVSIWLIEKPVSSENL
mgnify:FL=1